MTTRFRIKGVLRNGIRLRNSARTELSRIPNASFLVLSTDATTANNIRPNHPKIPTRSVSSAQIARPMSSFSSEAASTTNDINSGSGLDPEIEEMDILGAANSNEQLSVGTMDRTAIREARFNILRNCKHPTKESAHQAQKKLEELARESILIGKQLANVAIYNNVLDATAKCGVMTGFRKANELLEKMHERHEAYPHCSPAPNTISYHCVLDACARSSANKHTEAAKKAEELIKKMEELSQAHPDGNVHPETRSYDMVIMAHAHQAPLKYGAANAAEDWLRYLSKLNTEGGAGPSSNTFNFVLQAWKSSPEDKGADRALELLHLMIKLNREGHHEQVRPCERSFANVIQAFANRNRPEEAEDVLKLALSFFLDTEFVSNYPKELVDVRRCFNIAINGWAKSSVPDAPERADSLLRDMRTLAQETLLVVADPDIFSHTSCMEALANSGRSDAPEIVESRLYSLLEEHSASHGDGLLPTPVMFDCVIRTWFRSDKENKADRMESLLNALIELAQRRKNNQLLPRPRTVNLCLNAWCRAGDAKGKALHLLNRMEVIGCTDSQSYLPMIESLLEESQQNSDSDSAYAAAVVLEKLQAQIKYRGKIEWPSDPVYLHNRVFMALRKIGTGAAAGVFEISQTVTYVSISNYSFCSLYFLFDYQIELTRFWTEWKGGPLSAQNLHVNLIPL